MVNVFAPGATTPKNAAPLAVRPGAAFSFGAAATALDATATWAIDASLGNALVAYIASKTAGGGTILVGQRIKADGTWLDAAPVALANLTGPTAFFMTHGPTLYFVTYGTPPNTTTISIDAASATLTPMTMPVGTPAPFGPPVGSTLLAVGSASTGPSVVDATTLAVTSTVSQANWSPKPLFPNEAFYYSGNAGFLTFYPAAANGGTGAPCGRIGADGSFTNAVSCNLPVGDFLAMVGPRPPRHIVAEANGALLYADIKNVVHQWFEAAGSAGDDMPFPVPTRTPAGAGGPPQQGIGTFTYFGVAGGHTMGLTAYVGNWTSSTGEVAGDVYARWIQPGLGGGATCAKDADCQSRSCVSTKCTQPIQPSTGDAGTPPGDASNLGTARAAAHPTVRAPAAGDPMRVPTGRSQLQLTTARRHRPMRAPMTPLHKGGRWKRAAGADREARLATRPESPAAAARQACPSGRGLTAWPWAHC